LSIIIIPNFDRKVRNNSKNLSQYIRFTYDNLKLGEFHIQ